VSWRQVEGPALRELATSDDGFRLTARSPELRELVADPLPWGVIPLSPRTRGEIALEATWTDGRRTVHGNVRVAAAPRSRGLTNVALGTPTYLGGEGWRVHTRPPGSAAAPIARPGFAVFEPDGAGDYQLTDHGDRPLLLRAGRYDETPLDCGRAGCHPAITDAARTSPMTTVLARGLAPVPGATGPAFGAGYPDCALACHATGDPGARDGGFLHVASELGIAGFSRAWQDLPRPLRRLGSVGCLACHGPAALPPAVGRADILRADVCATCHDAPPGYGHVLAWQSGAMARADRDPRSRHDAACARCHTTSGFLAALAGTPDRHAAHADARPMGITCAACHAVHDHRTTAGPPSPLLRAPTPPVLLVGVAPPDRSAVCLGCHTPDADEPRPSATAAAIFFGRGGVDPTSGAPLPGGVTHARVADGCLGCHRSGPSAVERGAGHRFATAPSTCRSCHAQVPPTSDLAGRARRLWQLWRGADTAVGPPHAGSVRPDRRTPRGRAAWNVLLVLEDPAAAAHNAPYARALLAAAERAWTVPSTGGAR
jgi:hypothetical protein